MSCDKPKLPNDIRGWIFLALLCLGGSTGGSFIRPHPPPAPHNPAITTESWIKIQHDVEKLREDVGEMKADLRAVIRRMDQQG